MTSEPEDLKVMYPRDIYNEQWGIGEWTDEPDYVAFMHNGIRCEIMRNCVGAICGYIIVEANHPWHTKDYHDIDAEVHGGLTFAQLDEDGSYWVGFDCAHSGDIAPSCEKSMAKSREGLKLKHPNLFSERAVGFFAATYKNINFVTEECKRLADQAIEAANASK